MWFCRRKPITDDQLAAQGRALFERFNAMVLDFTKLQASADKYVTDVEAKLAATPPDTSAQDQATIDALQAKLDTADAALTPSPAPTP